MFTLYSGNNKKWGEMTVEERKICLVILGIIILGIIGYEIYYYLKGKYKD